MICRFARDRLAASAKLEWSKDHSGPDAVLPLPPLLDSTNARMALAQAQKVDDTCDQISWQKRKELDPKWGHRTKPKASMVQPLKPLELAEYRLAPDDGVLEKRVLLGSCCLWVPVVPDMPVPGEPSKVGWRRWLYDHCHSTFLNPHRPAGESFQQLRRCGFWETLTVDFNRWYSECEVCHRHRARPVAAPLRSITGDDSLRSRLPWSDVIVDVQGPYTKGEGANFMCSPTTA